MTNVSRFVQVFCDITNFTYFQTQWSSLTRQATKQLQMYTANIKILI